MFSLCFRSTTMGILDILYYPSFFFRNLETRISGPSSLGPDLHKFHLSPAFLNLTAETHQNFYFLLDISRSQKKSRYSTEMSIIYDGSYGCQTRVHGTIFFLWVPTTSPIFQATWLVIEKGDPFFLSILTLDCKQKSGYSIINFPSKFETNNQAFYLNTRDKKSE